MPELLYLLFGSLTYQQFRILCVWRWPKIAIPSWTWCQLQL